MKSVAMKCSKCGSDGQVDEAALIRFKEDLARKADLAGIMPHQIAPVEFMCADCRPEEGS